MKNTLSLFIATLTLLLYGCLDPKETESNDKTFTVDSLTKEERKQYCNIFGKWLVLSSIDIETWEPNRIAEDSEKACAEEIEYIFSITKEKLDKIEIGQSTITLNQGERSKTYPLWRIIELGELIKNKKSFDMSYFMISFDNGCKFQAIYESNQLAKEHKELLKSNLDNFLTKNSIPSYQEKSESADIYTPYKSCFN